MTKLQLLHRALNERMMEAVEQIMEMVGGTVLEYEEETARVRKENEVLRRRLQSMEEANRANWPGPYDPVSLSTLDQSTLSQQEQCAVSFEFGQESQAVLIKTEFADDPLYIRPVSSLALLPQSTDQGSPIAGTSASITHGQTESVKWPSIQSYMEPLEFDPTSSTMITYGAARGKRQRMSFACPDCGKVFGREQTLMFHLRTHSTEKPYEYRRRKACFYGDSLRKRKLQGLSQISRKNTNVLDGLGQANRGSPSAEHPSEEQKSNSLCTKRNQTNNSNVPENIASNPEPLQRKKVKKRLKKKYDCGDRFYTSDRLKFHMRRHVNAGKSLNPPSKEQEEQKGATAVGRILRCLKCDKIFRRVHNLNSHKKMCHVNEKELLHEQTELAEKETETEKTAMPEDGGSAEVKKRKKKIRTCPHCGKVYTVKGCLRTHIQTVHTQKTTSSHFEIISCFGRTRSQRTLTKQLMSTVDEATLQEVGTYPCPICKKAFSSMIWLKKHMRFHLKEMNVVSKKESETVEMQSKEGKANKQQLKNTVDKVGTYICKICKKVYSSKNWLRKHMCFHRENKQAVPPKKSKTSEMQSNKRKANKQPSRESALEESEGEETANRSEKPVSATTCGKKPDQNSQPGSVLMSRLSLQPKVVLEPIMSKRMYWNTVPTVNACKSSGSESSSFNVEHTSPNKIVNVMEGQTVDHCTRPAESISRDNQNKDEKIYSVIPETEIVCVTVGLPQNDSQSELLNQEHYIIIDDEAEETEPKGTTVSKPAFHKSRCSVKTKITNPKLLDLVFSDSEDDVDDAPSPSKGSDKKKTTMLDENRFGERQAVIVIDDETQKLVTQTGLKLISSELVTDVKKKQTKLWFNKQTAVTKSVYRKSTKSKPDLVLSDKKNTDNASKGFDEKKMAPLDKNHPSVCLPNDSQILNSETESKKADDVTHVRSFDSESQQTDGDGSVSQEERPCETSELIFADRASLPEHMQVHADKKLLDVQDIIADDKTNKGPSVNVQMPDSNDSEESGISRKIDPSVKNVKSYEEIDMLLNSFATSQSSKVSCTNSKIGRERKEACESQPNQTSESHSFLEPEVKGPPVFNIDNNTSQQDLDAESLNPPIPDPLWDAEINPTHLDSVTAPIVNTSESADQSCTVSDISCNVLQASSVDQTDHPQPDDGLSAVNQPLLQTPETSDVVSLDSSFSQDLESNSALSPIQDTQQIQVSDVQRAVFIGSDSSDVKTITDPDSCNIEQDAQSKSIQSENPLNSHSDANLNPPVHDIKPRAVGQICYPKANDCDLTEHSHYMTGDGSDDATEAQRNSATSVTCRNKRKIDDQNMSSKEEKSRKKCPSAHCQPRNMDDDSQGDVQSVIPDSKVYACQHCMATFCSRYTLRRHEYTHTGERPFWCHQCKMGFIQKYRLLHHTITYHGAPSSTEQGKRPKRGVHGEKTMMDETSQDLSGESPVHLSDVNVDTEDDTASTNQDTQTGEFPSEEASSLLQLDFTF